MSLTLLYFAGVSKRGTSAAKAGPHKLPLNAGLKVRTTPLGFSIFPEPLKPYPFKVMLALPR